MQDSAILILDDERRIREEFYEYLIRKKFQVFSAEKPSAAFQILNNNKIDILFVDFSLPEMDGIIVLKEVLSQFPNLKVILMSGNSNDEIENEALKYGAVNFIRKPFRHYDVNQVLDQL